VDDGFLDFFVDPRSRSVHEVHQGDLFRLRAPSGTAIVRASDKIPSAHATRSSWTIVFTVVSGFVPPGPVFGPHNSFEPIDEPSGT
jgi:hypothetical protein